MNEKQLEAAYELALKKWMEGLEENTSADDTLGFRDYTWKCFRHLMEDEILEGEELSKRIGFKRMAEIDKITKFQDTYELLTAIIPIMTMALVSKDKDAMAVFFALLAIAKLKENGSLPLA